MNKKLLGIFLLLLFLQPLALKSLAFSAVTRPIYTFTHQQLQSNKQEIPDPIKETISLDVEDEDELSELENNSSEKVIICQAANLAQASFCLTQTAISYSKAYPYACYKEPLYILWSVFRI